MTTSSAIGAAIEGEKISIQTRQPINVPIPRKHPVTKVVIYCFRTGIQSDAKITQAYADPHGSVAYVTSMTACDDSVIGQTLSGWALKPIGGPTVKKGSGTHSASFLNIKGGCYARVDVPPKEHLDSPEICARQPPIQEILRT